MENITNSYKEELGKRLKEARKKLDLTQKAVCDAIGIPKYQTLSAYENGKNSPPAETIKALAVLYGVTTDSLLLASSDTVEVSEKNKLMQLVHLIDSFGFKIYCKECSNQYGGKHNTVAVVFEPSVIGTFSSFDTFIFKWQQLRTLLDQKTIDQDLYDIGIKNAISNLPDEVFVDEVELPF